MDHIPEVRLQRLKAHLASLSPGPAGSNACTLSAWWTLSAPPTGSHRGQLGEGQGQKFWGTGPWFLPPPGPSEPLRFSPRTGLSMTLPFLHHQKWESSPKPLLDSNLLQISFLLWSLLCDLG